MPRGLFASALALAVAGVSVGALDACSSDDPKVDPVADASAGPDAAGGGDAAAEGSPDAGPSTRIYESGTRLRARVVRGDGDARQFETFVDTKRNEPCAFVETAEGTFHCLPTYVGTAYSDAACTTEIAVLDTCTKAVKYAAATTVAGTCGDQHERVASLRALGAVLPPSTRYTKTGDGQCIAEPVVDGLELRAIGAPVPLTELVAATVTSEDVGAIRRERLRGADGSSLVRQAYFDLTRAAASCAPTKVGAAASEDLRCAPRSVAFTDPQTGPFGDATCTTFAAGLSTAAGCPAPTVVRRIAIDPVAADAGLGNCGSSYVSSFFALGAPLPTIYRLQGTTCTAQPPDRKGHALGPSIADSAFPAVPKVVSGAGRVRLRAITSGTTALEPGQLWDDVEETECEAAPFADGKLHCLPRESARNVTLNHYKDPACTQRIILGRACGEQKLAVTGEVSCAGGVYGEDVYPLGAAIALSEYYDATFGPCDGPNPNVSGVARDMLAPVKVGARLAEVVRDTE